VISYRVAPLLDSEGEPRGWLIVFQDITNLKRMQEQVVHAERLAALGRLAAGLAHEMRNPLGSISGSLEIIRDGANLDEDERRLIRINLTELERLADLVTQMLELARPRPPNHATVDVTQLTSDIVRALKTSSEAEELTFELNLPDSLTLRADPDQMRQLLWNLLRNAVQASPPGAVVRVRAKQKPSSVVFEIQDEGAGIPPDDIERVFEPFFSTKRGGIGMGLAICRQVVVGHRGDITVELVEPTGTLFRVELPTAGIGEPTADLSDRLLQDRSAR
jgi:two-component system sensor histidine kinase PilS (NtrC family)